MVLLEVTSGATLVWSFYAIMDEILEPFGLVSWTSVTNPGCRFMHQELFYILFVKFFVLCSLHKKHFTPATLSDQQFLHGPMR